jgi:hypothetical protein
VFGEITVYDIAQASDRDGYVSAERGEDDGNINAQGDICVFSELVTKLVNCSGCLVCTGKPKRHYATYIPCISIAVVYRD